MIAVPSSSLTGCHTVAGAVFTHGTNSLEETLFLGDLLINCGKRESPARSHRIFTLS